MIEEVDGDIFLDDAEVLVNPVNCIGVMGKGLALQFKNRHPSAFTAYRAHCESGQMEPGGLFTHRLESGLFIAHIATKDHWRYPSRLVWVLNGLRELAGWLKTEKIPSVAVPPLGAGLGGLRWGDVRNAVHLHLGMLDVDVRLYAPHQEARSR